MLSAYAPLFRVPGATRFIAGTALSRTGGAMFGVAIIVMLSERRGSFGLAGAVSAVGPVRARHRRPGHRPAGRQARPAPGGPAVRRVLDVLRRHRRGAVVARRPGLDALRLLRPERRAARAGPDVTGPLGAHLPRRARPPAHRDVVRAGLPTRRRSSSARCWPCWCRRCGSPRPACCSPSCSSPPGCSRSSPPAPPSRRSCRTPTGRAASRCVAPACSSSPSRSS